MRGALARALGARVMRLERRPSPYGSSFRLEELDVALDDGRELALMFKDAGPGGMTPRARAAKPALVLDPLRELEVYERILAPAALGTAALHGADRARGWLFLERVEGVALWQAGDRATWEEVARWLARAHAALAGAGGAAGRLLRHDARLLRLWPRRAARFAGGRELRRIAGRYEDVAARLLALPATLLHGDLYASNVLVDAPVRPSRICPVDWEMAGVGPALLDLAALVSGWREADRRRVALAYREAMPPAQRPEEEDFLAALDACGLHVALQWLGWAPRWRPPAEHDHDWRGEALELAERLGV
ncbi:MAG TPA: phosphotransferase [Solirubrobacteraceae bacterium]